MTWLLPAVDWAEGLAEDDEDEADEECGAGQIVQETFYPAPASPSSSPSPSASAPAGSSQVTVDVYNGGNTQGLARQVSAALAEDGYTAGKIGNTSPLTTTEVLYGPGSAASASTIASLFNVTATASSTVPAGHVEVLLGADAALPNVSAAPTPSASPSFAPPPTTSASPSFAPPPTTGPQGGAVNAEDGIPCVN